MRILIFGLPGSGKSFLAEKLCSYLGDKVEWINADKVREEANDWDFTIEGRDRQANRMRLLAYQATSENRNVIADFVCPTKWNRKEFDADYTIWMNTIKTGRYEDTNKMFEEPKNPDFIVTHFEADMWAYLIKNDIYEKFNL